jgi:hypothetical protein
VALRSAAWLTRFLAGSLAVSVAGNFVLWMRAREVHAGPPAAERFASSDTGDADCRAELETCHRAASGLALGSWARSWGDGTAARPAPAWSGTAAAGSEGPGPAAHESVCTVAEKKLRDQWLEKRDEIAAAIARDIPDAAKTRADAERDAKRAAEGLGLEGRTRAAFEDDYARLRARRIGEMAPAAKATPVDWPTLLERAEDLFVEEDALVERDVGAGALERFRQQEMESRVTILTLLATYADADWDGACLSLQAH